MPFELTVPGPVIVTRVFGVFTSSELDQLAMDAEALEATQSVSLDRLTDLTAVQQFEMGFVDIYHFAVRRGTQRFSRIVKSAIIVQEPLQFGMARIYESLNDNPQIELRILHDRAEAKAWFAREKP